MFPVATVPGIKRMDIEKAISLNSSQPRKPNFQRALKKGRRYINGGLSLITPGGTGAPGPSLQTDVCINNSWQILRHSAAFINNILRLLPVGPESRRSRRRRNSAGRGPAYEQTDARCQRKYTPSFESITRAAGARGPGGRRCQVRPPEHRVPAFGLV